MARLARMGTGMSGSSGRRPEKGESQAVAVAIEIAVYLAPLVPNIRPGIKIAGLG